MKHVGRPRKLIVALAVFAGLSGASTSAILAAGDRTTIRAGNLVIHAGGSISPTALPKDRMAPISVHASGSVATADGTHIPPAQTLDLHVDRHLRVDSEGLPSSTLAKLQASSPAQAMKSCGGALVGKGRIAAQVEFPESAPFNARGPLLIFNGPTGAAGPDYPEMLFYTFISVPAPTAVIAVAKLSKDTGRYGFTISVQIPEVAGGSGSLEGFELTADRHWTYRGKRNSYLNAECPDGHFFNQLEAAFGGGANLSGIFINSCRPRG
ncbi:MAG TPA: hypothetical protein VND98_00040 [Solirubrobacterales bacterium]|nr:hypothetical protein [Solirubrobacterales bacterium]